jgi:hypothetical protein
MRVPPRRHERAAMKLVTVTARGYTCPLGVLLKLVLGSPDSRDPSRPVKGEAWHISASARGDVMGKHARMGLLLGASGCLLAVMVDWVIEELHQ